MQLLVSTAGLHEAIRQTKEEIERFYQMERIYGVVFPGEIEVLERRVEALQSEL